MSEDTRPVEAPKVGVKRSGNLNKTYLRRPLGRFKVPMIYICNPRLTTVQIFYFQCILGIELRKFGLDICRHFVGDIFGSLGRDETTGWDRISANVLPGDLATRLHLPKTELSRHCCRNDRLCTCSRKCAFDAM